MNKEEPRPTAAEVLGRAKARTADGALPFEAIDAEAGAKHGAAKETRFLIEAIKEKGRGWSRGNIGGLFDRAIVLAEEEVR